MSIGWRKIKEEVLHLIGDCLDNHEQECVRHVVQSRDGHLLSVIEKGCSVAKY